MNGQQSAVRGSFVNLPVLGAFALFILELLVIGIVFKHGIDFDCRSNWPVSACKGASGAMVSIYGVGAAIMLFGMLFRDQVATLFRDAGHSLAPLGMNLAGLLVALLPVTFLRDGSGSQMLALTLVCWSVGMAGVLAGLAWYVAPVVRWKTFAQESGMKILPLIAGGICAPLLATLIRPIWHLDAIANATFIAVEKIIRLMNYDVLSNADERVIGFGDFFIDIAPVCSGIEGIALVTIFVSLYLFLFRDELRFPRVLLLYPIGIAVSASLNVVRIVVLLAIGLNGNAELAVGGFHSHAGWLMFTIVSLGIVITANTVPWFRKSGEGLGSADVAETAYPFFADPMVARILPFAVFMFSAMLAQAFSQSPGVVYPLRALLMAGVLVLFLPFLRSLPWRLDPVAIAVGAAIGVMWVAIPVADPGGEAPYGALTGGLLALWFVARGIGTIVLVPIIEELFFRDYLEGKLRWRDTLQWSIGAAVVTASLFALLHDRWVEAFVAGLAFSYVMRRSGQVTDAIVSHAVANAIVFAVALATKQMHII